MIIVGGALSVTACAPEPVPEPERLTISQAGARYLDAVCPVNSAWDAADVEIDRLRIAVARETSDDEIDTRLFSEAIHKISSVSARAETQLGDPGVAWPKGADRAITDVRASLAADAAQAETAAALTATEVSRYSWEGADGLASAASDAREALGLPDDPDLACEARE